MGQLGVQELFIILIVFLLWVVPIAAGVWVLVTLKRIRAGQDAIRHQLEELRHSLQQSSGS